MEESEGRESEIRVAFCRVTGHSPSLSSRLLSILVECVLSLCACVGFACLPSPSDAATDTYG